MPCRPLQAAALALLAATPALADSCWTHNGSLMRLVDEGTQRAFLYEAPRPGIAQAGAEPGDALFIGANVGNFYQGQARIFSAACPDEARPFNVQGPVMQNPLRIVMTGQRPVYQSCMATGQITTETLLFVYSHQC